MRKLKFLVIPILAAAALFVSTGTASANSLSYPVECDFSEGQNFRLTTGPGAIFIEVEGVYWWGSPYYSYFNRACYQYACSFQIWLSPTPNLLFYEVRASSSWPAPPGARIISLYPITGCY